jgi:hypothetical protein
MRDVDTMERSLATFQAAAPLEGVPKRFWLYRVKGAITDFTTGRRVDLE